MIRKRIAQNLLILTLAALLSACTGGKDEPSTSGDGNSTAAGKPAEKPGPEATSQAAGATKKPVTQYGPGDARADLLTKLQPAVDQANQTGTENKEPTVKPKETKNGPNRVIPRVGLDTKPTDDIETLASMPPKILTAEEAKLVSESKDLALLLSEALKAGDRKKIEQCFVNKDDLEGIVKPGMMDVISGMAYSGSKSKVGALIEAIAGQQATMEWNPGRLHETPNRPNIWAKKSPMLIAAVLTLEIEGAPILVQLEQVLYSKSGWKILRMR